MLTDAQRAQLEGDEHDPFDAAGVPLQFRAKERHVGLAQDGRLVASTGLTDAEVEVGGVRFEVVGIGGVFVARPRRGEGLARRVLEEALARAQAAGPSFALLFCHPIVPGSTSGSASARSMTRSQSGSRAASNRWPCSRCGGRSPPKPSGRPGQ